MMLDGHVAHFSQEFMLNLPPPGGGLMANDYPFYVPD